MTPRMDMDYEDSMDGPPPSVASVDSGPIIVTPKPIKKAPTGVRTALPFHIRVCLCACLYANLNGRARAAKETSFSK